MPAMLRPNKEAAKILYKIQKIPKELQQNNEKKPSQKMLKAWFRDSSQSQ